MNEVNDTPGPAVVESEPTATTSKKKAKKNKAKKGKAKGKAKTSAKKGSGAPRGRKIYSLVPGLKLDDYKPQTHLGAIVHALRVLREGTRAEIMAEVKKQGKIKTDMKLDQAVGYALWDFSVGKSAQGKNGPTLRAKAAPKKADQKKTAA